MYQFDKMTVRNFDNSNKKNFKLMKFELVTVEILAFGKLEFELNT
jgi:hypothetical protein